MLAEYIKIEKSEWVPRTKIPEMLFTILLAIVISFVFSVFPFDLIRIRWVREYISVCVR